MKKRTLQELKTIASKIHNNRYCYDLWPLDVGIKSVVDVICVHGTHTQMLQLHLLGHNPCPDCAKEKRIASHTVGKEYYIKKSTETHGDKYDYSLWTDPINSSTIVDIICSIHGIFHQKIDHHVTGSGCQQCGRIASSTGHYSESTRRNINNADWLRDQNNTNSMIEISNTLNVGDTVVGKHFKKLNIPVKMHKQSAMERQCVSFLDSIGIVNIVTNDRNIIHPKELDIYLPDYNLAIELCGLYWHCDRHKHKEYHKDKHDQCRKEGIQLITIFEDEWVSRELQVKSKLKSLLHLDDRERVFARNTKPVIVTVKEKHIFLDRNHIQGNGPGSVNIGLVYHGDVVACMSLIKQKSGIFYLNRFATSKSVVGGFSKLLKYFQTSYDWTTIISFADLRWSDGNLYKQTGFTVDNIIRPEYSYVINGQLTRIHKFNYRRKNLNRLLKQFDPNLTEHENCDREGLLRVWDCGKIRFVLNNSNNNNSNSNNNRSEGEIK